MLNNAEIKTVKDKVLLASYIKAQIKYTVLINTGYDTKQIKRYLQRLESELISRDILTKTDITIINNC